MFHARTFGGYYRAQGPTHFKKCWWNLRESIENVRIGCLLPLKDGAGNCSCQISAPASLKPLNENRQNSKNITRVTVCLTQCIFKHFWGKMRGNLAPTMLSSAKFIVKLLILPQKERMNPGKACILAASMTTHGTIWSNCGIWSVSHWPQPLCSESVNPNAWINSWNEGSNYHSLHFEFQPQYFQSFHVYIKERFR